MLDEGTLMDSDDWLKKARMWRFVFLQEREGFFEPTDSLAFAMLALRPKQVPKAKVFTGVMKYVMQINRSDVGHLDADDTDSSDGGEDGEALLRREEMDETGRHSPPTGGGRAAHAHRRVPAVGLKRGQNLVLQQVHGEEHVLDDELTDCPLTYSAEAIRKTLPRALKRINDTPKPQLGVQGTRKSVASASTGRAGHAAAGAGGGGTSWQEVRAASGRRTAGGSVPDLRRLYEHGGARTGDLPFKADSALNFIGRSQPMRDDTGKVNFASPCAPPAVHLVVTSVSLC